ncbi:MAG: 4Fe-4S dicluster domain-containing protein [Thermoanaerobaculum sp.]
MASAARGWRVLVRGELCPLTRSGKASCRRCQEVCPVQAVELAGGPALRGDRCTGCGACAAVCPTGALRSEGVLPWQGPQERTLRVSCGPAAQRGDWEVPCLAAVPAPALAAAVDEGVREVALVRGDCSRCVNGAAVQARGDLVRWVRAVAAAVGVAELEVTVTPRSGFATVMAPAVDRRTLLRFWRGPEVEERRPRWRAGAAGKGLPFGTVRVVGDCFLCPVCVHACTAGALAIEGGRLFFFGDRCNGCGACADGCGFRALTVDPRYTPETATLAEGRAFVCKLCGAESFGTGEVCERCCFQRERCAASGS